MIVSWREPSMNTLSMLILSFTSTLRSFSVTRRSPGETCRYSDARAYSLHILEVILDARGHCNSVSHGLHLSRGMTLARMQYATYNSIVLASHVKG